MQSHKLRNRLVAATVLSSAFWSNAAWADCVSQAPVNPEQVVCDAPGTNGWDGSATNAIVVTVNSSGTVSSSVGGPALISTGTNSAVINFSGLFDDTTGNATYGIDAGSSSDPAISVGGGSVVTNNSGAAILGSVSFGNATGSATNVLSNGYSNGGGINHIGLIDGDVTAQGNFTFNNAGIMGWNANISVTQTGAGTVTINNGIDGGYLNSFSGAYNYQNGFIWGSGGTAISTEGSTTLVNHGGGGNLGGLIAGDIILGTNGTGTSSLTNGSATYGNATIIGNVTMADLHNTITNDGTITGDVTMNGTGSNTYNAGSLGSSGDNGLRLPGSQIVGLGAPTGTVSGTLTGLAGNAANNVLNLNGLDTSTLQVGSTIENFGVVNKNDSGTWIIKSTLDGNSGKLTTVNNNAGVLSVDNASFLGTAATTVHNNTFGAGVGGLIFNGTAAGTFAGNIDGTGSVGVTGANATTLTGTNTYTGLTYVYTGGVLNANSNGALSAASDMYMYNGTLNVNAINTVKNLYDYFGPNTSVINIASGASLSVAGGNFGDNGGVINGPGNLIKYSTGTLLLDGTDQIAPGSLIVNDGVVNDNNGALASSVAVVVNSTATTTGTLNINQSETIGSLAGTGGNAVVNIASGANLATGGLNTSTAYAGHITGAGSLTKQGTGAMTLTGTNTYAGGTSITGGSIVGYAGTTATNGSLQGDIDVALGASVVFDQTLSPLGNTSGTYAGDLTGDGFVTFLGNGTGILTLTGDNSAMTGSMNFYNNSIVSVSSVNNLTSGTLTFANGTLMTTADMSAGNAVFLGAGGGSINTAGGTTLTLTGGTSGTGALTKLGTGTLILDGPTSHTGGTTVSAGILQGDAGYGIAGDIVNNAQVNLTGTTQSYVGNMSGTGSVRVINNAIISMDGVNTYSGSTTVEAGSELDTFSSTGLSANSAFVVDGLLGVGGGAPVTATIGSLSGSGSVISFDTLNIGALNTSSTFAGTFGSGGYFGNDSVNVNKIGTGTLTLSGTGSVLTGNLGVNAGTLSLTGTLDSATTTVASGATLSVDGTLTSPTVTVAAGGRLIGGLGTTPGHITGAVTNSGTIAPGHSPGIIAISGSYTQTSTGTYAADVYGNGTTTVVAGTDFDRIAVSGAPGTAALAGTLAVTQNGGVYVAGTTYDIITTTGGITGNFATVTGTNLSAFLSLSNAAANGGGIQGNNYRLVVVRAAYNTAATNPNQVAVANGLTGIIGSTGAAATVNKIDNMTAGQAQDLFDSLSPEPYGAYATALQDQGELFTRQVGQRLASNRGEDGKTGLWITGYGSWADGKDRGDYRFGNDHSITGFAIGADFGSEDLRVGLAGGYSEDKVTYLQGNSAGKSKSWQVGGYLGYSMGKLNVDGQLAYISGDITASKSVMAGSGATLIQGTAGVDTNGHLFKGVLTMGYQLGGESFSFEPFVGINVSSGKVNGFTETGMGVLNLTVADIKADRTDLVVGARLAAPMGSVSPYLNATYRYDLSDHPGTVTGYFNGVSTAPFTVSNIASGRSVFDIDAGLSAKIGSSAKIFVGYQGSFRNDKDAHGVNGGISISF